MNKILTAVMALLTATSLMASAAPKSKKQVAEVDYAPLVDKNLKEYDIDHASEHIEKWEAALAKQKKETPTELTDLRERVLMARNMLERVEKIQIVDTLQVDSVEFFRHYRLSADAGQLLHSDFDDYTPKVVYVPQSYTEMIWSRPTDDGDTELLVADVLDDGTMDNPRVLGDDLGDEPDFPFLMQDGVTLYFGAKGENSIGGYDIFMTRRSDDGSILQPQNIGMPYNSPYNDFMLAIDETTNLGWWASDREQIPGKVTIYVFVPSKMRVNQDPDSDDIADFALLKNITLTDDLDERLSIVDDAVAQEETFFFPLGDGRVITRLSEFKNPQARQAYINLQKRISDMQAQEAELNDLRQRYAKGDKSVSTQIIKLENTLKDAPKVIKRGTNQIISLEKK